MEGVQEQKMKVSQRIEGLARLILVQRVSILTDRYLSCYVNYGRFWFPEVSLIGVVQKPTRQPFPTMPETFCRLTDAF